MGVKLEVLGSAGSYPGPGTACSSYLLISQGYHLLLDAGNGSMANLFSATTPDRLNAVVLTHEHTDHIADFVGIFHYRKYASRPSVKLKLFCPLGVRERLVSLLTDSSLDSEVEVTVLSDGDSMTMGPFAGQVLRMDHPVETYGIRLAVENKVISYSSDTGYCSNLFQLAKDADLLLCEATWSGSSDDKPASLHLTATQAALIASSAGVKRLILTHVAYPNSPFQALAEAHAVGTVLDVDIAQDRRTFEL